MIALTNAAEFDIRRDAERKMRELFAHPTREAIVEIARLAQILGLKGANWGELKARYG